MKRIVINRFKKLDDRTLGTMIVYDEECQTLLQCYTLELPWLNNLRNKSCIVSGYYKIMPRTSNKYKKHLIVMDVPNRDLILIHAGNFPGNTEGCILVGSGLRDIDGDKILDVIRSKDALDKLVSIITEPAELIIL